MAEELRAEKEAAIRLHDQEGEDFARACSVRQALIKDVEEAFSAVEDGDLERLRSWVRRLCSGHPGEEGAFPAAPLPIDVKDHEGNTLLSEAACYGEEELVGFLLSQSSHPNPR